MWCVLCVTMKSVSACCLSAKVNILLTIQCFKLWNAGMRLNRMLYWYLRLGSHLSQYTFYAVTVLFAGSWRSLEIIKSCTGSPRNVCDLFSTVAEWSTWHYIQVTLYKTHLPGTIMLVIITMTVINYSELTHNWCCLSLNRRNRKDKFWTGEEERLQCRHQDT